jgi:colanic acid/amylovoran biosynthesis glycosyltransferase
MPTNSLTIAYIVNQYPKVSHSFIRREIKALESHGLTVHRFSVRSCQEELVDAEDKSEQEKTKVILGRNYFWLLLQPLFHCFFHPMKFFSALLLALKLGHGSDRGILIHFVYLVEACTLFHWVSTTDVDHVHAHFGTNSTTVAMLCHCLGGPPYSFTVHGPEEFDKPLAIGLPEKIKHARFVVAISSFGKSQLYRWCRYQDWPKIQIIRCGVDDKFLSDKAVSLVPNNNQFVCVGRLSEQKGHFILLEAARQLLVKGYKFRLLIVGDGHLRKPISELIERYELTDIVEITGWATGEEVREYIQGSRAMVLPSFAEGLPVVIMEALAMGRPVISTNIAGIPELLGNNICGWLVTAGSVDSLTDAMVNALDAPNDYLSSLGIQGANRVHQYHSTLTESRKLVGCFSEIQGIVLY